MKHPGPSRWGEITRYAVAVIVSSLGVVAQAPDGSVLPEPWSLIVNIVAVIGALVAMRWRRRYPVAVALALSALLWPLPVLWAVASWAYLSLSTHRRWWPIVLVGLVCLIGSMLPVLVDASNNPVEVTGDVPPGFFWGLTELVIAFTSTALYVVALASIGSYLGARRDAQAALRERLEAAEREQVLVRERSRAEERNRIAREMHDVLAHKITLISMHAGALAYRDDMSSDEARQAAQTIQESSHQALNELRVILGQLRQTDGDVPAKPQPTLDSLADLIAEHRAIGRVVTVNESLQGAPSQVVSRQAYRVVQEALTNAARHAPGTPAHVVLEGGEGEGLTVRVVNPVSLVAPRTPGAGLGLIGLEERAEIVGGRFRAGQDGNGNFEVEVWLPW